MDKKQKKKKPKDGQKVKRKETEDDQKKEKTEKKEAEGPTEKDLLEMQASSWNAKLTKNVFLLMIFNRIRIFIGMRPRIN